VTAHSPVGVHYYFASSEPAVTAGAAYDEPACGVDVVLGLAVDPSSAYRLDDLLLDGLLDDGMDLLIVGLTVYHRRVLGGYDHGVYPLRHPILVLNRHLGLTVWSQPRQRSLLAELGQLHGQLLSHEYGKGHQLWRLIGGISEHKPLVSRAGRKLLALLLAADPHVDVQGLVVEGGKDAYVLGIETVLGPVVTDILDRLPDDLVRIH